VEKEMRRFAVLALLTACGGSHTSDDGPPNSSDGDPTEPTEPVHDADHDGVWIEEGDCDDNNYAVHPGADETCNGVDDDCDGDTDEEAVDATAWYTDADGDGAGDPATEVFACDAPPDGVAVAGDCNDALDTVGPGKPAIPCDGYDNDCDAATQEAGHVTLGGVDQPDLPTAVAAAADGDVIALCEGAYVVPEQRIAVALTIEGLGAPETTILAGDGSGAVLRASAATTLRALSVRGGEGHSIGGGDTAGGGVYVDNGNTLTLENAIITGNAAGYGAGVWLGDNATLTATDSEISGNSADDGAALISEGGGVYGSDGVDIALTDSHIDGNDAGICGGVSLYAGGSITGAGLATLSLNSSTSLSGGGGCTSGGVQITGLTIADNSSSNSGGGLTVSGGLVLADSVVARNFTTLVGGGISASGDLVIDRTTFDGNRGDNDAGAIDFAFDTATLTDCVLTSNSGFFFTGGVALFDAVLVSVDTDWGTGALDNPPADIHLVSHGDDFDYAGVASFTCTDQGGGGCL
jgi:hypothetical protein